MSSAPWITSGPPHVPSRRTVGAVMRQVLYALIPGLAVHSWLFGPAIWIQVLLAVAFALAFEALLLRMRGREAAPFLRDGSAVVTAVLFALCIPPLCPWWVSATGMLFAMVFAKHLYGGLGQNPFNPAMVGYVVVLIAFPRAMTAWPATGLQAFETLGLPGTAQTILSGALPAGMNWDALTTATPLDSIKTALHAAVTAERGAAFDTLTSVVRTGWPWLALAYAAGGIYLLARRIIAWQVPTAMLVTVILASGAAWAIDPTGHAAPWHHLFSASLVLGAFFIATDPVSGCTSPLGRLWFGAGVGLIAWVIRRWGGYPDGIAFAVLLMNLSAPLIDRYTRPRVYGQ